MDAKGPLLTVVSGRKVIVLRASTGPPTPNNVSPAVKWRAPGAAISGNELVLDGHRFREQGGKIVNESTGKSVEIPDAGLQDGFGVKGMEFSGCLLHGRKMIWLYTFPNFEATGEPYGAGIVALVTATHGVPHLEKALAVPISGSYGASMVLFGSQLLVRGNSGNLCLVSLNDYSVRSLAPDSTAISTSGRVFWLANDVNLWNPALEHWTILGKGHKGTLYGALGIGRDDLICFGDAVLLARSGRSFSFQEPNRASIFLNPAIGVAFVWPAGSRDGKVHGTLRSLKDLHEICPVYSKEQSLTRAKQAKKPP